MINITYVPVEFENKKIEGQVSFDEKDPWLLLHIGKFAEENREYYNSICKEKVFIYVNDKKVEVDDWNSFELKDNDNIKVVTVLGNMNAGGIIQTIIGVALITAAFFSGNPFVAAGALTKTGLMALVGASLVLGGVIGLLFSPTAPSMPAYSDGSSSPSYSWDGSQTTSLVDRPVGVVYGEYSVGGNILTAFVTTYGDKNYLNVLVGLSEGEIEGIMKSDLSGVCTSNSDIPYILINDQSISNYTGITWDYRLGKNNQTSITGFEQTHTTYSDSRKITTGSIEDVIPTTYPKTYTITGGLTYTTNNDIVDEIKVQLECPGGLFKTNSSGSFIENVITYKVFYRPTGTTPWKDATILGKTINPEWMKWDEEFKATGLDESRRITWTVGSESLYEYIERTGIGTE